MVRMLMLALECRRVITVNSKLISIKRISFHTLSFPLHFIYRRMLHTHKKKAQFLDYYFAFNVLLIIMKGERAKECDKMSLPEKINYNKIVILSGSERERKRKHTRSRPR